MSLASWRHGLKENRISFVVWWFRKMNARLHLHVLLQIYSFTEDIPIHGVSFGNTIVNLQLSIDGFVISCEVNTFKHRSAIDWICQFQKGNVVLCMVCFSITYTIGKMKWNEWGFSVYIYHHLTATFFELLCNLGPSSRTSYDIS